MRDSHDEHDPAVRTQSGTQKFPCRWCRATGDVRTVQGDTSSLPVEYNADTISTHPSFDRVGPSGVHRWLTNQGSSQGSQAKQAHEAMRYVLDDRKTWFRRDFPLVTPGEVDIYDPDKSANVRYKGRATDLGELIASKLLTMGAMQSLVWGLVVYLILVLLFAVLYLVGGEQCVNEEYIDLRLSLFLRCMHFPAPHPAPPSRVHPRPPAHCHPTGWAEGGSGAGAGVRGLKRCSYPLAAAVIVVSAIHCTCVCVVFRVSSTPSPEAARPSGRVSRQRPAGVFRSVARSVPWSVACRRKPAPLPVGVCLASVVDGI